MALKRIRALFFGKNIFSFTLMFATTVVVVNLLDVARQLLFPVQMPWLEFLTGYVLQTVVLILIVYFWFWRRFPYDRKKISLHVHDIWTLIGYVVFIFMSYFAFVALLLRLQSFFELSFIPGLGEQPSLLAPLGDGIGIVIAFVIAILIAPVVEEYVFRGWGLICLPVDRLPAISLMLNGALFALFHFQLEVFLPLIFLGTMLAWVAYHSKSILPGIVFHMINNSLAFLVDYWLKSN